MLSKRALILVSWCLGLVSVSTQVMIIRELLVAFTGNELTIATSLALWLLSVAAGCFIFKKPLKRLSTPGAAGVLFIIAAIAGPVQVVLIRLLHPLTVTLGEIPGPGMMMVLSLVGIAPCAVVLGGLFVAMVGIAERSKDRAPIPTVYGAEALGSGVGGLVLSIFLLGSLNPLAIVILAGIVSLMSALYLLSLGPGGRTRRRCLVVTPLLVCLVIGLMVSRPLDLGTRQAQWSPLHVKETVDTKYGNILVTDRESTYDFFESGVLAFTLPDPLYAEECTHIPLLHHPNPESVLLIGGAGSGTVAEVRKHPSVVRIDYVELDPAVIELVRRYSPSEWLEGKGIAVTPVYGDGRRYVTTTSQDYDVIIISVGTPVSLQINRYYTVEFFRHVKTILASDGVMSLKIPSEGAYLGPELASLLSALVNGCQQVFGHVAVIPGEYIHVLASPGLEIGRHTDLMLETLALRGLNNYYITKYVLWDRLSPVRIAHLDSLIARYDAGRTNTDGRPISFSYSISLWAKHFGSGRIISFIVSQLDMQNCLLLLVLLGFGITLAHLGAIRASWRSLPVGLAIYSMGLTTMFTEVLIVLGFQIVSGYIYARIAAIVAAFMFGMGIASSYAARRSTAPARPLTLLGLHCGLVAVPLVVVAAFDFLTSDGSRMWPHAPDTIFIGLALVTGAMGGAIFAVASSYMAGQRQSATDAGAVSYSLDLAGACVAGFATGFLIIPSLGLAHSAFAVSTFNVIVLIAIALGRKTLLTSRLR